MWRILLVVGLCLLVVVLVVGLSRGQPPTIPTPPAPSEAAVATASADLAPDFALPVLGAGQARLSELRGKKGVVVVFFTTWCPACVAKVPALRQLATDASSQQIEVWGINIGQDKDTVAAFAKKHAINYPVLLDQDQSVARSYDVTGIPYICLLYTS
ncbi:MAG: TlpA family protein disulfide reductase, partial [Planctomycetota bacterium]|nr:TlpA family protein disulfide reductase [Planctomycetota bacterium]